MTPPAAGPGLAIVSASPMFCIGSHLHGSALPPHSDTLIVVVSGAHVESAAMPMLFELPQPTTLFVEPMVLRH